MIFAEITKRNYMSVSVTLKSYFYEVLIPSSQKNTSSPIEDILHHVSISFMKKLALYKCFNPRTHTGCDKFKVLEITRQEMMDKLTRYGCLGICDMCNRPTSVGYYVAVINQWMCEDCYNDFIKSVDRYEEDMRIENRNFDRFCNLFNVEIEEKV